MPRESSTRQLSKEAQKAIDKEQKRNRGAISCAECRRLKLKCDKTVPCSSCKRRGCSAICPNGSLITGQGTRFVLADTEKLHRKITEMSDRIRQLEDALEILQRSVSPGELHPLLSRELLAIKSIIDLHAAVGEERLTREKKEEIDQDCIEALGTLAVRQDGSATFFGQSGGSECLLFGESAGPSQPKVQGSAPPAQSETVTSFSRYFPFGPISEHSLDLDYLVQHHLPLFQRAQRLGELYLSQAWFSCAVARRQLLEECLPSWYSEAPVVPTADSRLGSSVLSKKGPHDLALFFSIMCVGALYDTLQPGGRDNEEAKTYFQLAKVTLNLEPVMEKPPSVATVQTLLLLSVYVGMCGGEHNLECAWIMNALTTKLAQSVGLYRDCARWQLPSSEVQKRRLLFWEVFSTDCWATLATGRLSTFHLQYVDCALPNDPNPTEDEDGNMDMSFTAWKAKFGYECLSVVTRHLEASKVPKYSTIIELDRKVRDVEYPRSSQRPLRAGAGFVEMVAHYMPMNFRHFLLLYIHRCFFAQAVSNDAGDPMKSQYALSFLVGYRSACEILTNVRAQFNLHPVPVARSWILWTHSFSSAILLSSVVTHATGPGTRSKVTCVALTELRRAVDLFKEASAHGSRAGKFLPILQRLLGKAEHAFKTSTSTVVRTKDISAPSNSDEPADELSIFSGNKHRLFAKAGMHSSSSQSGGGCPAGATTADHTTSAPSPSSSVSPPSSAPLMNLHPTLLDQLANFDGDLNTQIYNAQRDDYYPEQDTPEPGSVDALSRVMAMEGHWERPAPAPQHPTGFAQHPNFTGSLVGADSERTPAWYGQSYADTHPLHPSAGPTIQHVLDEHMQFRQCNPHPTTSSGPYQFQQYQSDVGQNSQTLLQAQLHPYHHVNDPVHPQQHQLESQHSNDSPPYTYTNPALSHHLQPYPGPIADSNSCMPQQYWDGLGYQDPERRSDQPTSIPPCNTAQSASFDLTTDRSLQHHLQETWQSYKVYVGSPEQKRT